MLRVAAWTAWLSLSLGCYARAPGEFYASAERRDADLRAITQTRSFALGRPTGIKLTPDGRHALFLRSGPRDRVMNLYEFDITSGQVRELLTADRLLGGAAEQLSAEEKARRERQRLTVRGIASYELSQDGKLLLVPLSGKLYVVEREGGKVSPVAGVDGPLDPHFSSDGRWISFVRDYDLHRVEWRTGKVERLTSGGSEEQPNGLAEFVAQEEMHRDRGYWWSPDSRMVAYQHSDLRAVEKLHILDPSRADRPPQSWHYPRAGRANATVSLHVLTFGAGPVRVKWDAERYPYLAGVKWSEGAPLCAVVQSRDQKDELLLRVDPATGTTTELLHEHDDTWINLFGEAPHWIDSGRRFLWISEADGRARVWLHEADGRRVRALNADDSFQLHGLISVDEKRRVAYVSGAADATESHVFALALDEAAAPKALTRQSGKNGMTFSKNHEAVLTTFSDLSHLSTQAVGKIAGGAAALLPSVAEKPAYLPNVEVLRVGPHNEFDAAIVRPRDFRSGVKYPVVVSVYGGPGGGVVHRTAAMYFYQQWLADQGFIVVSSDNRGVDNRGRAWERAIYGDFADIPLDDQITALRAMGAKYPELDLSRVGITGWSFGGYMAALAVIRRGDVFAAGAAGAPVVDWTDYDTHYTERYLNTPQANPEGYRKSSILTYADQLHRPLLLLHGTADDNVYFGNSLKLTDALLKAGKPFELVPLAGVTHLLPDPDLRFRVESRIAEFFRRTLQAR